MDLTRGKIFLSYRRDDSGGVAALLYDRLAAHFGREQVFKDVDSLIPGDYFPQVIANAVGSCGVLLAVIGERWLTITNQDGARRLDAPGDFVRIEIETALERDVLVIPVLVNGARMPQPDELPASLVGLAGRHAQVLRVSRFDADVVRLLEALDERLSTGGPGQQEPPVDRGAAANLLRARAAEQIGSQVKAVRKMGVETLDKIVTQWPHSPEAQAVPEMLAGLIIEQAPWTPKEEVALARALDDEGTWTKPWPRTSGELPLPPWIAELPSLNARSPDVLAGLEVICRIASERRLELTLDEVDLRKLSLGEGREATQLRGVHFNKAHFEGSYLVRVDLSTSQLSGAHFEGAVMVKCLLPIELRNARFDHAELEDCRFPSPPLAAGASFRKMFFNGADLHDGVLNGADLRQASLVGANLQRASLQDASLTDANLSYANLTGCDLRRARLQRAELDGARLDDANLDDADLDGAHASPETRWPAGFDWIAAGVQRRSESFEERARRMLHGD